jgi:hypothetical protein
MEAPRRNVARSLLLARTPCRIECRLASTGFLALIPAVEVTVVEPEQSSFAATAARTAAVLLWRVPPPPDVRTMTAPWRMGSARRGHIVPSGHRGQRQSNAACCTAQHIPDTERAGGDSADSGNYRPRCAPGTSGPKVPPDCFHDIDSRTGRPTRRGDHPVRWCSRRSRGASRRTGGHLSGHPRGGESCTSPPAVRTAAA